METKEIKITIPEGYEIDKEKSTFECIKFKPITSPTYEDIARSLFKNKSTFFINCDGDIMSVNENSVYSESDPNNATNQTQLARLLAMNQLLNVAEYYNRKREKASSGYIIFRAGDDHLYATSMRQDNMNTQVPFFYSKEDADSVIYNPNFKELLDLVYLQ